MIVADIIDLFFSFTPLTCELWLELPVTVVLLLVRFAFSSGDGAVVVVLRGDLCHGSARSVFVFIFSDDKERMETRNAKK